MGIAYLLARLGVYPDGFHGRCFLRVALGFLVEGRSPHLDRNLIGLELSRRIDIAF